MDLRREVGARQNSTACFCLMLLQPFSKRFAQDAIILPARSMIGISCSLNRVQAARPVVRYKPCSERHLASNPGLAVDRRVHKLRLRAVN